MMNSISRHKYSGLDKSYHLFFGVESFTSYSIESKGDDHFTILNRKVNFRSFSIPALFGIDFVAIQVQSCLKIDIK